MLSGDGGKEEGCQEGWRAIFTSSCQPPGVKGDSRQHPSLGTHRAGQSGVGTFKAKGEESPGVISWVLRSMNSLSNIGAIGERGSQKG